MENTRLKIKPVEDLKMDDFGYDYLLAISCDGLYVLNREQTKIIETIVDGVSTYAAVASFDTEDDFLDMINTIKGLLLNGLNPLKVFDISIKGV